MSSLRTDLAVDGAALDRDIDRWISDVLRAGTASVRVTTRKLEKDIEATTRATVRGRMWRAWKSEVFPAGDIPAYTPTGTVYVNGGKRSQGMVQYWTQPGVNKNKSGYWLAIPTAAVGVGTRGRNLTPGEWERRTGGRLRFVWRGSNKPALLVAEGVGSLNGAHHFRELTPARAAGGQRHVVTMILFILIPFQRFANRIAINPIVLRHEAILAAEFERRVRDLERVT